MQGSRLFFGIVGFTLLAGLCIWLVPVRHAGVGDEVDSAGGGNVRQHDHVREEQMGDDQADDPENALDVSQQADLDEGGTERSALAFGQLLRLRREECITLLAMGDETACNDILRELYRAEILLERISGE